MASDYRAVRQARKQARQAQVQALAAQGGTVAAIARQLDLPRALVAFDLYRPPADDRGERAAAWFQALAESYPDAERQAWVQARARAWLARREATDGE